MKSYLHYIIYLLKVTKGTSYIIIIDVIILAFSVIIFVTNLKSTNTENVNIELLILLAFAGLRNIFNFFKLLRLYSVHFNEFNGSKLQSDNYEWSNILISPKEESLGYSIEKLAKPNSDTHYTINHELNDKLQKNEISKIVISKNGFNQIRRVIIKNNKTLLPFLTNQFQESRNKKKNFYNEEKLCLTEDIVFSKKYVVCHKGGYFDSFLTNERFGKKTNFNF